MAAAGGPPPADVAFPYSFLKPSSSLTGSGRSVSVPAFGVELDWEIELAIVMGPGARRGADPRDAIFGYTILNDLSLRDFVPFPHPLGLDALICKGFDGATPIGPWITPADAVDINTPLNLELRVNGEVRQNSTTEQMIFSVRELVEYYTRVLTLEPGDVIATGTPAGVGAGMQPPQFLKAGDEIEAHITGLGSLTTSITEPLDNYSLDIHEGEKS
jgi:2-keto-4-pentenoate hydratase/2-oxohepta-3-ene-1,7-dioic acid hydratase in catechol pathway